VPSRKYTSFDAAAPQSQAMAICKNFLAPQP